MTRLSAILVAVLLAAVFAIGHAAEITGKVTGEAKIDVPADPRIVVLETEVKKLRAELDQLKRAKVSVGTFEETTLGELMTK